MKIDFYCALLCASVAGATQLKQMAPLKFLSQMMTQQEPTCLTTALRAREKEPNNFYDLQKRTKSKYEDQSFSHGSEALYWANMGEADGDMASKEKSKSIEWMRASDNFPSATLFGSKGVQVGDISQGFIGNCWILSALAAVADSPGRIEKLFLNTGNEQSAEGVYAVNLYVLGLPMTIMVDDYLPLTKRSDDSFSTVFTEISDDGSLWGPILEKAFAKRYGNYEHIVGGLPTEAVRTLTGAPYQTFTHDDIDIVRLWNLLSSHDSSKDFTQAGTEGSDDTLQNSVGLVKGHAYTVLGVHKLSRDGTRLVKIRNPWGSEVFHGAWSDDSPNWD